MRQGLRGGGGAALDAAGFVACPAAVVHCPAAMKNRLRIAVSVFFAVVCVALCVLWAMSYTWLVGVNHAGTHNNSISLFSMNGAVRLNGSTFPRSIVQVIPGWTLSFGPAEKETYPRERWELRSKQNGFQSALPHWFLILVSAILAAFTRVPLAKYRPLFRFSLRTMLIATTLVAVVLGLVAVIGR